MRPLTSGRQIDNAAIQSIDRDLRSGDVGQASRMLESLPIVGASFGGGLRTRLLHAARAGDDPKREAEVIRTFLEALILGSTSGELWGFANKFSRIDLGLSEPGLLDGLYDQFFDECGEVLNKLRHERAAGGYRVLTHLAGAIGSLWSQARRPGWEFIAPRLDVWRELGPRLSDILATASWNESPLIQAQHLEAFSVLIGQAPYADSAYLEEVFPRRPSLDDLWDASTGLLYRFESTSKPLQELFAEPRRFERLPLLSLLAVSCRCARRVQPLMELPVHGRDSLDWHGADERSERGEFFDLDKLIRQSERIANGERLRDPLPGLLTGAGAFGSIRTAGSVGAAARSLSSLRQSDDPLSLRREFQYFHNAVQSTLIDSVVAIEQCCGTSAAHEAVSGIQQDVERLAGNAERQYLQRGRPLDPSDEGPLHSLWPNGDPEWYAKYRCWVAEIIEDGQRQLTDSDLAEQEANRHREFLGNRANWFVHNYPAALNKRIVFWMQLPGVEAMQVARILTYGAVRNVTGQSADSQHGETLSPNQPRRDDEFSILDRMGADDVFQHLMEIRDDDELPTGHEGAHRIMSDLQDAAIVVEIRFSQLAEICDYDTNWMARVLLDADRIQPNDQLAMAEILDAGRAGLSTFIGFVGPLKTANQV